MLNFYFFFKNENMNVEPNRGVHTLSSDNKWDNVDIDKVVCEVHGNKCAIAGRENTFRLLH